MPVCKSASSNRAIGSFWQPSPSRTLAPPYRSPPKLQSLRYLPCAIWRDPMGCAKRLTFGVRHGSAPGFTTPELTSQIYSLCSHIGSSTQKGPTLAFEIINNFIFERMSCKSDGEMEHACEQRRYVQTHPPFLFYSHRTCTIPHEHRIPVDPQCTVEGNSKWIQSKYVMCMIEQAGCWQP